MFKYNKPTLENLIKSILSESRFNREKKSDNKLSDLDHHFQKHRHEFYDDNRFRNIKFNYVKSRKKYDDIGDKLSKVSASPISEFDNPDVRYVGFITKDGRTVKFDKVTADLVAYAGPTTITLYNLRGGSKKYNDDKVKKIFNTKVKKYYKKDIPKTDRYQKR